MPSAVHVTPTSLFLLVVSRVSAWSARHHHFDSLRAGPRQPHPAHRLRAPLRCDVSPLLPLGTRGIPKNHDCAVLRSTPFGKAWWNACGGADFAHWCGESAEFASGSAILGPKSSTNKRPDLDRSLTDTLFGLRFSQATLRGRLRPAHWADAAPTRPRGRSAPPTHGRLPGPSGRLRRSHPMGDSADPLGGAAAGAADRCR